MRHQMTVLLGSLSFSTSNVPSNKVSCIIIYFSRLKFLKILWIIQLLNQDNCGKSCYLESSTKINNSQQYCQDSTLYSCFIGNNVYCS